MRLKKLVLHGFKSFADRTEFKFDQSVTVVVGPNGCGKSNVVDAIKWVLGEQSAKSLRGGAMLDVIFNGAESRKPAGLAEVELVFENPQRPDGAGRYLTIDADDVSVTRRLYRDGTSEYLVNGHTGRLKDIKELFLDTGVGVDAYSIIEQGRVARLLEANPVERRQIFEEAAGISRFKVRKKEAQRKLEKVDENLERLGDITKEIESRLRSVKIQAGRARTYQELAQRLGELRLQHALHEYHTLHGRLTQLRADSEDARFRLDDATGNLARSESELLEKREAAERLGAARQQASHELVETKSKIQQAAQHADYARRQLEQFAEQVEQIAIDQRTMAERADEVERQWGEASASLAELTEAVIERRGAIESKQVAHRDAQLRNNEVARALDEQKSGYLDAMRKFSQVEARLNSIEIERRSSAGQKQRLDERAHVLAEEAAQVEAARATVVEQIAQTVAEIDALQSQSKDRAAEQQDLGAALKDLTQRLGAEREHRSGLLSRQKMLRDLEARREGISDAVQRVLKQRDAKFSFIRGLVADVISVDVEHAHGIEAALDGRDQWLVADASTDLAAVRGTFDELNGRVNVLRVTDDQVEHAIAGEEVADLPPMYVVAQGELLTIDTDREVSVGEDARPMFLPIGPVPSAARASHVVQMAGRVRGGLASSTPVGGSPTPQTHDDAVVAGDHDWTSYGRAVTPAIDLVRFEPADRAIAMKLLGRTLLVETLDDALALHADGPAGWRFVTRAGEVVEADGTYRVGPLGASMGILSRRSELESVTHQIAEVEANIARLSEELSHGTEQAKSIESAIAALRQDVFRLNTTRVELNGKQQQADGRLAAIGREKPIIDRDLAQLAGAAAKLDEEADRLTEQKQALHDRQAGHQEQMDALADEQQSLVDRLRHAAEELTAARVAVGQLEEKQVAARQSVQRLESQRVEIAQQVERLAKSMATIEQRRGSIERDLAQAEHQRETLATTKEEVAVRLAELEGDLAGALASVATLAKDVDAVRGERGRIEQTLHKLDVDLSQATTRMEGLVVRAQEEVGIDIAEHYLSRFGPRKAGDLPAEEMPVPEVAVDWDAIAEEIKQLRDRIQRLGNVNLDAIAELDELETRQTEYTTQVADLTSSKLQLESLIDQLNADSSARFAQTFEAVRIEFQQMFRKLFGGGKADIVLETELIDKKAMLAEGADPTAGPVMRRVDPLDAGIEVIARPPGKNPVTLSQLSGGEKAMTCIALLMSIFKAKPSPFCILDEVDAPLDEANNGRFTQIVQEFLSISQFIIITHHKKTMQIADVMYGITQQTHGVSTRVPVRFDQVDHNGRVKDEAIVAA